MGRQVLVRIRAASLNYRDHAIASGRYHMGALSRDTIPLSDGAGEVLAVGPEVTDLAPGDRVMNSFAQPPLDGSALPAQMLVLSSDQVDFLNKASEQAAGTPAAGIDVLPGGQKS